MAVWVVAHRIIISTINNLLHNNNPRIRRRTVIHQSEREVVRGFHRRGLRGIIDIRATAVQDHHRHRHHLEGTPRRFRAMTVI
jgi:hypothetical protein